MFNTKHRVAKLGTLLAVASLGLAGLTGVAPASAADTTTTVKIHLDVIAPEAQGWNLWYWNAAGGGDGATTPNFDSEDGYGVYTQFDITQVDPILSFGGVPRSTEDWGTAQKDFGTGGDLNFSDVVDGQLNEYWCTGADLVCTNTAPAKQFEVRVHVNKVLADTQAAWDVFNFGADDSYVALSDTPGFTGADYVDDTEVGSYASFKITPTDPAVAPHAILNSGAGPVVTNGIGIIVRGERGNWGTKKTGDTAVNFNANNVGEIWCEVVDVATLGCSDSAPDPVTHVTVHINQPLDAAHNYVIWDNHVTNNTDVLFAPTFTSEDRFGAISKFKFTDTSIKSVRFYITDGRAYDATKVTGSNDKSVAINAFNGEVWCDVVAATPTCTETQPSEDVTVTVHINKGAATTAGWNVGYQSLGNPVGGDSTPNVTEVDANNSILTWTVENIGISDKSTFEWLLRNKEDWSDAVSGIHTPGDLIKPTGANNLVANITGGAVEIWCDATNYADPTYNDPADANYKTPLVPLVCSQAPSSITVHYNRPLRSLLAGGWELAAFGTGVGGDTRVQFTGEDLFGATAVIHYNPSVTDVSNISFVVRKYQPFVAATDSTVQKNLDAWSCIDPMDDCTGGFFRQTTGDRVVPAGASEVWTLAGSSSISATEFAAPSNKVVLKVKQFARGAVRVWATAGAGTTPTAIVIDAKSAGKKTVQCTIARKVTGTTLKSYCNIWGLKKGAKYTFVAHAVAYGIGTSLQSARTKAIVLR
jgi:hypothetical protein